MAVRSADPKGTPKVNCCPGRPIVVGSTVNRMVAGSSPARGASDFKSLRSTHPEYFSRTRQSVCAAYVHFGPRRHGEGALRPTARKRLGPCPARLEPVPEALSGESFANHLADGRIRQGVAAPCQPLFFLAQFQRVRYKR